MGYEPEALDWRRYWLERHLPGVEKWVFPDLDDAVKRPKNAPSREEARAEPARVAASGGAAVPAHATLLDLVDDALGSDPGRVVLERLTAAEVARRVAAGAARLRAAGVRAGDRVALQAENSPAWALGAFAVLAAGATLVPIDAALSARDVASLLHAARARAFFASAKRRESVEALSLEDLTGPAPEPADRLSDFARDPEAPASLIFTSGTTGAPKGVLLPHRAFASQVAALGSIYELSPVDHVLSVLPLHHAFEFTCGLLLPLAAGAAISYAEAATPEAIRAAIARVRPTAMIAVPALLEAFVRAIRREARARGEFAARAFEAALASNRALRDATGWAPFLRKGNAGPRLFSAAHAAFGGRLRLLVSGGAALPRASFETLRGLGFDVYEGYGLTEAGPVVAAARPGRTPGAGSVGEPIPGTEVRLEGRGEILVRGPGVMLGYDGDAAASAAAIDPEGWLRTGDLGRLDAGGALAIVGRVKDAIVDAAGNTVHPDEVEEAYARAPEVQEIGVARVRLAGEKEVVGALVLPKDGASEAAILARFREIDRTLPFPKRLKVVRFARAPLPRTATRKVKREEVSQIIALELAADRSERREPEPGAGGALRAREMVAEVAGREAAAISLEARLQEDLGLDSIALVDLATALAKEAKRSVPEGLEGVRTVADVARLLANSEPQRAQRTQRDSVASVAKDRAPALPPLIRRAGNALLTFLQRKAYEGPLEAEVEGRARIPWHTNALVVANHCSHLDVGLVKHALGDYGRHAASLAARDYFFSSPLKKLYFESFTEVLPLDRKEGDLSRDALDGVVERLVGGETVILFPEGTRSTSGEMGPFRPGLAHLVMRARVGVLPVYLSGTFEALPKGASVPRGREVGARIGEFIPYERLAAAAAGSPRHEAYRAIAEIVRGAIGELRDGRESASDSLQAASAPPPPGGRGNPAGPKNPSRLATLLASLPERYRPGRVEVAKTFYVKAGEGEDERWTIRLEPARCEVTPGKAKEPADCVVRASAAVLVRLLKDGELPSMEDIATGAFKTNDPDALRLLVEALALGEQVAR